MENKIYVVECSSGSYDSFHWWIGGIFTNKEDAEQAKDTLNEAAKKVRDEAPKKTSRSTGTGSNKWWKYKIKHPNEMEWSEAKVKEYPLGEMIPIPKF